MSRSGAAAGLAVALGLAGPALPMPPAVAQAAPTTTLVSPGGVAWTWGANSFGELGDGSTVARPTPGQVSMLDDVIDMHGGREHVIALRGDRTVWVWGSNGEGQLGLGTTANRSTPTQVPGLTGVQAVETGHNSSVALMGNGTVRTWGLNADGQLGDGSTTLRRSPVAVVGLSDAVSIAAGRDMSYAIRADGTVVAWGRNDEGQLGDGTTVRRTTPVRVGTLTDIVDVAGGRDHGLALKSDGTVWAWGSNDYGQLGDGTTTDRTRPVQVLSGVTQVIAGAQHSYALRADGTVAAWGRNYRANLGDGTTTTRTRPVSVRNLSSVVSIGSGRDTGTAVLADGRLMAWGNNSTGQVGDGTTTNRSTPVVVPGVSGAVLAAGGGAEYSVVLVGSGPPPPQGPVASFTATCTLLSCDFDASTSHDPDGEVVDHSWAFGDTTAGSGSVVHHDYTAAGTYVVTVTVTDDSGATASTSQSVVVQDTPAPPVGPRWRSTSAVDANSARPAITVPNAVESGDRLVLFVSANRAATLSTPTGWTLLNTASDGTEVRSWVFTRVATTGQAGSNLQLAFDATTKAGLAIVAYAGAGAPSALVSQVETASATRTHAAPAAPVATALSTVLRYYVDKGATAHSWALAPSLTGRVATTGTGSGFLTVAVGEQADAPSGAATALSATSGISSAKAIAWTLVLPPG